MQGGTTTRATNSISGTAHVTGVLIQAGDLPGLVIDNNVVTQVGAAGTGQPGCDPAVPQPWPRSSV
ncbi:hypothetical protein ACWC9T_14415 [Kitasatospora sp. NPDC001159]